MTGQLRFISMVLLAATAAATIALPFETEQPQAVQNPVRAAVRTGFQRFRVQSEYFRRAHSRAAFERARAQMDPDGLMVVADRGVSRVLREWFEAVARNEINAAGSARVPVVLAIVLDTASTIDGVPVVTPNTGWTTDNFPPQRAGEPCGAVVRVRPPHGWHPPPPGHAMISVIGVCAWYAAYGHPGDGVRTWLDSTHYAALLTTPLQARHADTLRITTREAGSADEYLLGRELAACSSGVMRYCRHGFTRPAGHAALQAIARAPIAEPTPGWTRRDAGDAGWSVRQHGLAARLLTALETEVGTAGFMQFWTDDRPLPEALLALRNESIESWTQRKVIERAGVYLRGPLASRGSVTAVLLVAPVLVLAGASIVGRRGTFA